MNSVIDETLKYSVSEEVAIEDFSDSSLVFLAEQLRLLEHGLKIKIVVTEEESFSVYTPSDLEYARRYYKNIQKKGEG